MNCLQQNSIPVTFRVSEYDRYRNRVKSDSHICIILLLIRRGTDKSKKINSIM